MHNRFAKCRTSKASSFSQNLNHDTSSTQSTHTNTSCMKVLMFEMNALCQSSFYWNWFPYPHCCLPRIPHRLSQITTSATSDSSSKFPAMPFTCVTDIRVSPNKCDIWSSGKERERPFRNQHKGCCDVLFSEQGGGCPNKVQHRRHCPLGCMTTTTNSYNVRWKEQHRRMHFMNYEYVCLKSHI